MIQGNWIIKHGIRSNGELNLFFGKDIYEFYNDSLTITDYSSKYNYRSKKVKKGVFKLTNDKLESSALKGFDSISIAFISKDSLVVKLDDYSSVFEKLMEFQKINLEPELRNILLSKKLKFHKSNIEFEFFEDGMYVTNNMKNFSTKEGWNIDIFEDEVFLIFAGSNGPLLQLKEIKNDSIYFNLYSDINIEVIFSFKNIDKKYQKHQLIGHWQEIKTQIDNSVTELDLSEKNIEWLKFRSLIITDSSFQRYSASEPIYRNWSLSKSGEIIIFGNHWKDESKFQWNIKKLNEDTLVIHRKPDYLRNEYEEVTYRRIN